jgi:hypothetical protein
MVGNADAFRFDRPIGSRRLGRPTVAASCDSRGDEEYPQRTQHCRPL